MLRFLVPAATAQDLEAELAKAVRGRSAPEQGSISSVYLDSTDRRLARAGLVWCHRQEGQRWIQRLRRVDARGGDPGRLEHEVLAPSERPDALLHAGSAPGERLLALLRRAEADGVAVAERYRCELRHSGRRLRSRGALIEVSFDRGHLIAPGARLPVCELGLRRLAGPPEALEALAQRWSERFGLQLEPRDLAERGAGLSLGQPHPPLRKARLPAYAAPAGAPQAMSAAIDECVDQIARNAVGVLQGDPGLRAEHVHQLRVGIRRLRSALRCFEGWAPQPAEDDLDGLKALFAALGACRDADVLDSGVTAELARVGAPPVQAAPTATVADPQAVLRRDEAQRALRLWVGWRDRLPVEATPAATTPAQAQEALPDAPAATAASAGTEPPSLPAAAEDRASWPAAPDPEQPPAATVPLPRRAERRLARWHARIVAEARDFDTLEEPAVHALRKRVKRQRYAVEFFAPLLRRRGSARYLARLALLQDRMGELNDLFVARTHYQALLPAQPAAWFALGWLAARLEAGRASVQQALQALAEVEPPRARR